MIDSHRDRKGDRKDDGKDRVTSPSRRAFIAGAAVFGTTPLAAGAWGRAPGTRQQFESLLGLPVRLQHAFAPHAGTVRVAAIESGPHEAARSHGQTEQFSVIFESDDRVDLPEGLYRGTNHTASAAFDVFVVPRGRAPDGRAAYVADFAILKT